MGVKILLSADWHLDSPFGRFSRDQRQLLRREMQSLPEKITDVCRREGCDLVLLAGDLFDGPPSRETLENLRRCLAQCGVPVFISPGNHDFCGPGSPWLEESWPENVHIFTGGLESVSIPALDCRIWGAGYRSMDCPPLLEGFRAEGPERYRIGLLHGDPATVNSPCCPVTAAQVRDSGLDLLALGHIHKAGAFRGGKTLCVWPGCPMGRGWDETGDKGACLLTLGDTLRMETVPLDTVCFYELEGQEQDLEGLLPALGNSHFYRVTLTGTGQTPLAELRDRLARFPNLELADRRETPPDLWAEAGEDTLRGVYFRRLRELSEEEPNAILAAEISLRLLSGKEVSLP